MFRTYRDVSRISKLGSFGHLLLEFMVQVKFLKQFSKSTWTPLLRFCASKITICASKLMYLLEFCVARIMICASEDASTHPGYISGHTNSMHVSHMGEISGSSIRKKFYFSCAFWQMCQCSHLMWKSSLSIPQPFKPKIS